MAPLKPFFNLTNSFFSISPTEYYKNLLDEMWGCFKHVGMDYDMILRLPIQERRAFIRKHNMEADAAEREMNQSKGGSTQHLEGSAINEFARRSQNDVF